MTVSPARRRYAAELDKDRARLERIGVNAATKIGRHTRFEALKIYKAGDDPSGMIRDQLNTATPLLVDAMVAAYLKGRWRVLQTVRAHQAKTVKLSTAYDNAINALQKQMHYSDQSIDQMREAFAPDVANVIHDLTRAANGRVSAKMLELTQRQAHVGQGIAELQAVFNKAGITPQNSYTLENIFRTQTQLAYGGGRWAALHEPEIDEILWGFEYSTVGDDRVRSSHYAMDGVRLPKDHSFWQSNFPPNGWSCRCQALEIFEGDDLAKASRIIQPKPKTVDGVKFHPEADRGFAFNPGQMYDMPDLPVKHARNLVAYHKQSKIAPAIRDAVDAINRVHGVPKEMVQLPVRTTYSKTSLGYYMFNRSDGSPIELALSQKGPFKRLTMVHELGHYLDHHGIGTPGHYASGDADGEVQNVMNAIIKSKSYRQLKNNMDKNIAVLNKELELTHSAKRQKKLLAELEKFKYPTSNHELFARSYAQFIASKPGNGKIREELEYRRSRENLPMQWPDDDFKPINKAMDKLVHNLKWMR